MRNIKSTLRFVRNSALLFVAASGMSYLTACSETDVNGPDDNNKVDDTVLVEQLKLSVGSNPSLATTYPNSHMTGTRAELGFKVPEMKTMPTIPTEEALNSMFKIEGYFNPYHIPGYDNSKEPNFYVPAGSNFVLYKEQGSSEEMGFIGKGSGVFAAATKVPKYYVAGEITIPGTGQNDPMEIHILKGGKLTDKSIIQSNTTVYLYEGGDIVRASQKSNEIYISGTLIAEAPLVHEDTDITVDGKIYTTAKLHGKIITLNGGEVYAGCAVTAKEKIYLTGNNSVMSTGYVSAPEIALSGNNPLNVVLRDGGYLHATKKLSLTNIGNVFVVAEDGDYAMVETDVLDVNNKVLKGAFQNIGIKYNSQEGTLQTGADEKYVHLEWNELTQVYWVNEPLEDGEEPKKVVFDYALVEGDECAPWKVVNPKDEPNVDPIPGTKPDPTPDPTPGPTLENIGSVSPTGNHTHPISATCIYTNNKDAYLSWHTQGGNFHGCIEYLTVDNGTVTLNSYLETSKDNADYGAVDFNHVIFDNGKIFVAGDHPKKGGILGWIECNNGKFVTGEAVLNIRSLYNDDGGSGNCIIRNGNYYQVASVKGFETYNVADFVGAAKPKAVAQLAAYDFDPAGESATGKQTGKHIATDGNKVVMLTLINRDKGTNTAKASIKVYDASDIKFENAVASYIVDDAVLSPVDGKDVIAIKGDDIWVCLGKGGVQHLKLAGNTITKFASFKLNDLTEAQREKWAVTDKQVAASCANGLAVGNDGYVYVAHGGSGLVVLNKEDLSFVTRSRHNGGNSANYVALHEDGYIYVAYGKSNVQVFGWRRN